MNDGNYNMLEMRGITKRFPGVVANDGVDLTVKAGQVHTLLGENGAGKSTLMKILYGLNKPDEGEIIFEGESVTIASPADAIAKGIGMIHQHFMLVPTLTVAENVALGLNRNLTRSDMGPVRRRLSQLSEEYGLKVDPDALIWQLAVGERQRAEILKALYREAKLLVLDEPTAVLTPPEVDDLFVTLRQLRDDGRGLIFISHKLHEVMDLSDEITVLRDGRVSGHTRPAITSREELARMMVGRPVELTRTLADVERGAARLLIRDLTVIGDRGTVAVDNLSLTVHGGEVVGIAGVSGNGQRELAEAIMGLRTPRSGSVEVAENDLAASSPKKIRQLGVSYVPEERMKDGVVGQFSVAENLLLVAYERPPFTVRGLLNVAAIGERCRDLVQRFSVKTPSIHSTTRHLSGGNIQKVVIAREFTAEAEVLVVSQPTRGVDIGAAEYIHERLLDQRAQGSAVLLISEDLDEVFQLSDRILVLFEGRIAGEVSRADATAEAVGLLMSGVVAEASV